MLLSRLLMPLWVAVIAMASLSGAVAAEWRVFPEWDGLAVTDVPVYVRKIYLP